MSKTTLCALTATCLAVLSVGFMIARYQVLGNEVKLPAGPGVWKVTLLVEGQSTGETKLTTAMPLHFQRQHISNETFRSEQMVEKPPHLRNPDRSQVIWTKPAGTPDGPVRARCEFYCTMDLHRPTTLMSRLTNVHYAAPKPGDLLEAASPASADNEDISTQARELTDGKDRPVDQARALFSFVEKDIAREPSLHGTGMSAAECLENQSGDSGGKSRLLVALLRSRGIPARLVTGLILARGENHRAHHWVEGWIDDHWLPMCPTYNYFDGRVPATYLIFGFGDMPMVRGRHVRDLEYAFSVEPRTRVRFNIRDKSLADLRAAAVPEAVLAKLEPLKDKWFETRKELSNELGRVLAGEESEHRELILNHARTHPETVIVHDPSPVRRFFKSASLSMLRGDEQRLVGFLLLLPIAALIICIYRNLIGMISFGTFAPALLGLAFHDPHFMQQGLLAYIRHSLPGVGVFVVILLIGWGMRRLLNYYHLLQVPRIAFMLSFIVVVLIAAVVIATHFRSMPPTTYISLFPLVILTGMIERFWTLEAEDSTISSFKTLLNSVVIAATIALLLSIHGIANHMFCYPETLGLVMAAQLLIGRYTGFRLTELFRFRDFLTQPPVLSVQR